MCCSAVIIFTAQLHSTKPELWFCAGSNPAHGVSEIHEDEDLWQWSRLEIRLKAFRRSTIPQKQFIIIINGVFFNSNNELLNSSVPIREDSFVSINLQSILFRVFRRVILLASNKGQWRKKWDFDSISIPQLQRGLLQLWKLWLNLCSRRWLSPRESRVINLIPLWLQQLKKPLGSGSNKFNDIAFETTQTFSVPNGRI